MNIYDKTILPAITEEKTTSVSFMESELSRLK